jgi:predicted PhzF superfamily epimerase YddE/YHI9
VTVPIFQVDAFTSNPFAGNPAAVCLLPEARDESWMQEVAREMNLSETAFLVAADNGHRLRWFTPEVEVELCGHATLASAHVLWTEGREQDGAELVFHTVSGELVARRANSAIELDFPARPLEELDPPPPGIERALGAAPVLVGRSRDDLLVELEDEATLRALSPDFAALRSMPTRGTIATALSSSPEHDFVSRFFAPAMGIDEDPVTGSAHCVLAPYWAARLGKTQMRAFQASRRGGSVTVRYAGDRVFLVGEAVTVLRGLLDA